MALAFSRSNYFNIDAILSEEEASAFCALCSLNQWPWLQRVTAVFSIDAHGLGYLDPARDPAKEPDVRGRVRGPYFG